MWGGPWRLMWGGCPLNPCGGGPKSGCCGPPQGGCSLIPGWGNLWPGWWWGGPISAEWGRVKMSYLAIWDYFNYCIYPKTQSQQIKQSARNEGPEAGYRCTFTNTLQCTFLPGHSNLSLDNRTVQCQVIASFGRFRGQKDHKEDTECFRCSTAAAVAFIIYFWS